MEHNEIICILAKQIKTSPSISLLVCRLSALEFIGDIITNDRRRKVFVLGESTKLIVFLFD